MVMGETGSIAELHTYVGVACGLGILLTVGSHIVSTIATIMVKVAKPGVAKRESRAG